MNDLRLIKDHFFSRIMQVLTVVSSLILVFIFICLFLRSKTLLHAKPLTELLFSTRWHPLKGEFGFLPFIAGTLVVTGIALVIAVPLSLLAAIYLS